MCPLFKEDGTFKETGEITIKDFSKTKDDFQSYVAKYANDRTVKNTCTHTHTHT